MDRERAQAVEAMSRLNTEDIITEFIARLRQQDHQSKELNDRAVDLETAVYWLLNPRTIKRNGGNNVYKAVEELLCPIQQHLRNPALYKLACDKAKVAGSIYVKGTN